MRLRAFPQAGEQLRPFSEVLADRRLVDPRTRVLNQIAELEGAADAAEDPDKRKLLQCEAEALRCALEESK